jgi:Phytanoyl-CoA dioxygenase (PhyH)
MARVRASGLIHWEGVMIDPETMIHSDYGSLDARDPRCIAALAQAREAMRQTGCAVLPNFLRAELLPSLVNECDRVAVHAHRNFNRTNVYFTTDDPRLPADHPKRQFFDRSNAFVPADHLNEGSYLRALYEWPAFTAFVKAVLQEENFYRYADPLADVIVNTAEAGGGFPWHFDTNNYTVTLAIQNAEDGGAFEFVPNCRSSTDECYEDVAQVLRNESDRVIRLNLKPFDLQLFRGRYALHRVTPLRGARMRYVAIFSYADRPDMVGSVERTTQLYGRVLPIHLEKAGIRSDALID